MTEYKWYQSIGICPICHKQKIYEGETMCLRCGNRRWAYTHTAKVMQKNKERMRQRHAELKAKGICIGCTKRPAMNGRTLCVLCLKKKAAKSRIYYAERKAGYGGQKKMDVR